MKIVKRKKKVGFLSSYHDASHLSRYGINEIQRRVQERSQEREESRGYAKEIFHRKSAKPKYTLTKSLSSGNVLKIAPVIRRVPEVSRYFIPPESIPSSYGARGKFKSIRSSYRGR